MLEQLSSALFFIGMKPELCDGSSKNIDSGVLKPLCSKLFSITTIIVYLEDPFVLSEMLFQYFHSSFFHHYAIYFVKFTSHCCSSTPKHYVADTPILYSWDVLRLPPKSKHDHFDYTLQIKFYQNYDSIVQTTGISLQDLAFGPADYNILHQKVVLFWLFLYVKSYSINYNMQSNEACFVRLKVPFEKKAGIKKS